MINIKPCDHSGLDSGPCDCVKHDRCYNCCGKCNKAWDVWYGPDPRYKAQFQAATASQARQLGYKALRNAAVPGRYTDMRARRAD